MNVERYGINDKIYIKISDFSNRSVLIDKKTYEDIKRIGARLLRREWKEQSQKNHAMGETHSN